MKPISLLIFDLDGTLVNTLEDIAASLNDVLTRFDMPSLPIDRVCQYVGDGITMLMRRALGGRSDLLDEAVALYKEHHKRNLVVRTTLYPGVLETLESFRSIPMAVVTNKAREFSSPILEQLGIMHFFAAVIGADSGLPLKPAPDAFLKILRDSGVSPEDAAVVGDGTTDMRAGRAAGIATCAVTYGYRSVEELRRERPDYVIQSLPELKGLFVPTK